MQCLDPQTVETKDALAWLKQSFALITRRYCAYISLVTFIFIVLFLASQSINTLMMAGLAEYASSIVTVFALLVFSAFTFYFIFSNLILLSFWSDQSERFSLHSLLRIVLPNQKTIFKMALLAIITGLLFWCITLLFHPDKNLLTTTSGILQMLASSDSAIRFIFSESAVFLYFLLVASLFFRTLFSLPLILFHQLSYHEARALSQKAIQKNLRVLGNVMLIWIVVLLLVIKMAPVLAVLLIPLFSTYLYVAFRHIFWGQGCNEKVKQSMPHAILE